MIQLYLIGTKPDFFQALLTADAYAPPSSALKRLVSSRVINTEHYRRLCLTDTDYLREQWPNWGGEELDQQVENLHICVSIAKKGRLWFNNAQYEQADREHWERIEREEQARYAERHARRDAERVAEQQARAERQAERDRRRNAEASIAQEYWSERTIRAAGGGGGGSGERALVGMGGGGSGAMMPMSDWHHADALHYAQRDAELTRTAFERVYQNEHYGQPQVFLSDIINEDRPSTGSYQAEDRVHRRGQPQGVIHEINSRERLEQVQRDFDRRNTVHRVERMTFRFADGPARPTYNPSQQVPDLTYTFNYRDVQLEVGFNGNGEMVDARLPDGTQMTAAQARQAWDHLQSEVQLRRNREWRDNLARPPLRAQAMEAGRRLHEQIEREIVGDVPNALESLLNDSPVGDYPGAP